MRLRCRHSSIFGLVLALALAGLLVMHGFDAGAVAHGPDGDVAMPSTARHGFEPGPGRGERSAALPDAVGSEQPASLPDAVRPGRTAAAGADGWAGHVGWGHVVAMCVVVLATVVTGAVRRVLAGPRVRVARGDLLGAGGLVRRPQVFRPPGPGRLALCVLTC